MKNKKPIKYQQGGGLPDTSGIPTFGSWTDIVGQYYAGNPSYPKDIAIGWNDYFNSGYNGNALDHTVASLKSPMGLINQYHGFLNNPDPITGRPYQVGDNADLDRATLNTAFMGLFAGQQGEIDYNQRKATTPSLNDITPVQGFIGNRYQMGGIPTSPLGQWQYPGQEVNVPGNNITMQGINHPNLGIGLNTGLRQVMYPGQNYTFPGDSMVREIPLKQMGGNPYEPYAPQAVQTMADYNINNAQLNDSTYNFPVPFQDNKQVKYDVAANTKDMDNRFFRAMNLVNKGIVTPQLKDAFSYAGINVKGNSITDYKKALKQRAADTMKFKTIEGVNFVLDKYKADTGEVIGNKDVASNQLGGIPGFSGFPGIGLQQMKDQPELKNYSGAGDANRYMSGNGISQLFGVDPLYRFNSGIDPNAAINASATQTIPEITPEIIDKVVKETSTSKSKGSYYNKGYKDVADKLGLTSKNEVEALQKKLGVTVDGVLGPKTLKAIADDNNDYQNLPFTSLSAPQVDPKTVSSQYQDAAGLYSGPFALNQIGAAYQGPPSVYNPSTDNAPVNNPYDYQRYAVAAHVPAYSSDPEIVAKEKEAYYDSQSQALEVAGLLFGMGYGATSIARDFAPSAAKAGYNALKSSGNINKIKSAYNSMSSSAKKIVKESLEKGQKLTKKTLDKLNKTDQKRYHDLFNETIKETSKFQFGGQIGYNFSDDFRDTMNNGSEEFSEVQSEIGEVIASTMGDIVDVAAKVKHDKMDDDFITDTLTSDNYIFSNTDKMKFNINNKYMGMSLKDIIINRGAQYYREGEKPVLPKEYKFSDVAPSGDFTPAEYLKNLRKKFPVTERKNDAFATIAQRDNKESRMPYIELMAVLSESKKKKSNPEKFQFGGSTFKGMPNLMGSMVPKMFNQSTDNAISGMMYKDPMLNQDKAFRNNGMYPKHLFAQPSTLKGGSSFGLTNSMGLSGSNSAFNYEQGGVPKAGAGMFIGMGLGALTGLFQGLSNRGKINKIERYWDSTYDDLRENNTSSLYGNLAATAAQQAPQANDEYLNMRNYQQQLALARDAELRGIAANRGLAQSFMGDPYTMARFSNGNVNPALVADAYRRSNALQAQNNTSEAGINSNYYTNMGTSYDTIAGRNQQFLDANTAFRNNTLDRYNASGQNYLSQDSQNLATNFNVRSGIEQMRIGNTNSAIQTGINGAMTGAQIGGMFGGGAGKAASTAYSSPMTNSPFSGGTVLNPTAGYSQVAPPPGFMMPPGYQNGFAAPAVPTSFNQTFQGINPFNNMNPYQMNMSPYARYINTGQGLTLYNGG